jgi:hypothetical protein
MLDASFIKEAFYLSVHELGAVITFNPLDLNIKLILCPSQELLLHFLCFTLVLQKEHLSKTRIIISNDKTVFVTTNTYVGDRTKQLHV